MNRFSMIVFAVACGCCCQQSTKPDRTLVPQPHEVIEATGSALSGPTAMPSVSSVKLTSDDYEKIYANISDFEIYSKDAHESDKLGAIVLKLTDGRERKLSYYWGDKPRVLFKLDDGGTTYSCPGKNDNDLGMVIWYIIRDRGEQQNK